jgi:SAM-dependent methyltransferase
MADEQRLSFGDDAELYDRVRPAYPAELIDDVLSLVDSHPRALDAGCGTGKATVMLAQRGASGVGVEPERAMAAIARRRLDEIRSDWRIDISDFERWRPRSDDGHFDLIVAAQSWHWIDRRRGTEQAAALLRQRGWIAIFGHVPAPSDTPLRREIDAIYRQVAPRSSARSRAPADKLEPIGAFDPPIVRDYLGFTDYTADEWNDLVLTSSDHKMLRPPTRDEVLTRLRETINRHGGSYRHEFNCQLWAARRR